MKSFIVIAVASLLAIASRADSAWTAMQQGLKDYADGNFANAATNFDAASTAATKEKFDPAVPAFNRANALLKSGKAQDAAHTFEEALRTSDLGLQSKAYHNRGNTMLGIAGSQEQEKKFQEAIKSVDEALAMYERAMMLSAQDRDPKINYELAGIKRQELEQMLKEQQQQQQNKDQEKDDQKQKDDQKNDQKNKDQKQDQPGQDQQQREQDQNKDGEQDQKEPQEQQPGEEQQQEQRERTEKMTPQEAAMLLDAMKQREQAQREKLAQMWLNRSKTGKQQPVDKDW